MESPQFFEPPDNSNQTSFPPPQSNTVIFSLISRTLPFFEPICVSLAQTPKSTIILTAFELYYHGNIFFQIPLYAEFDRPKLLTFLRNSNYYPLQKVNDTCWFLRVIRRRREVPLSLIRKLKDVRAQKFHAQIFLKLATQKGNDILLPKRQKKIGGHRLRFGENMPRKIP